LPRLRFFDVTVVTSDLTSTFAVFLELILVLLQSIVSTIRVCCLQRGKRK
jgi:hypothetical protein